GPRQARPNAGRSGGGEFFPWGEAGSTRQPRVATIHAPLRRGFNRRNWDGVRELISANARLEVFERFAERAAQAPYVVNYERWPWPWKLAVGNVDGEPVVLILKRGEDAWTPYSAIRFDVIGQRIDRILDYIHCPPVIEGATTVTIGKLP